VEEILTRLTGAESACVVNNNAGAVFLSLNTIARGREVVVSRGQLVEIGGSFRIPDIMAASGCELVEVGTTNRTHRSDYENAVTERTGLLLKVHTSNFRVIGFSRQVELEELVELGRAHGVPVMEDLGSGNLTDLGSFGLAQEPTAGHAVQAGADVVTFSGDKLLGGPQAGVILGRAQILDRIKRNPLMRILRVDKMTLAGLEATLKLYQDPEQAMARIPTLRLMMLSGEVLADRAHRLATLLAEGAAGKAEVREEESVSTIGGGALPGQELPTWAVSVEPSAVSVNELEASLRSGDPPVIGRIEENRLFLDVRTVAEDEIAVLAERVVSSLRG